jgi:hypothetical protein
VIFDLDDQDLDELILDNASYPDSLRGWIVENGYQSPGFVSARRSHPHGYPPNIQNCMLLVAAVFGRFKVLFADKNNSKSHQHRNEDWKSLVCEATTGVEHLDEIYQEIIDVNGSGTHEMED